MADSERLLHFAWALSPEGTKQEQMQTVVWPFTVCLYLIYNILFIWVELYSKPVFMNPVPEGTYVHILDVSLIQPIILSLGLGCVRSLPHTLIHYALH